jgi:hypothetical protein
MYEPLLWSPDIATLNAYAITLGPPFWDPVANAIVVQGPLPGGGEYFLNFALDPDMPPGVWARLRINGENMFALGLLPMPPAPIVVYPPTGTPGMPDGYVQPPYGQIA